MPRQVRSSARHPAPLLARLSAIAACWIAAAGTGCGEVDELPPNLVLVTVDSLRADFLACYGGRSNVGVHMCGLGEEGSRYVWAFAPASSSAPSIASLLTSQYPSAHGVDESAASFLPSRFTTLAEELRGAGYATAAFVGSPELNRSRNLHQGFDLYDDQTAPTTPAGLPWRRADESTAAALQWIEGAEQPWFVWIHYREPHGPYESPALPDSTDSASSGARAERLRVLAAPSGRGGIPGYQAIPGLFTREGYEARYRTEIRAADTQIAALTEALEARAEPFGIAVTADHGEAFGEDRYFLSHGHSVGLDQIRVPLFWRPPRGGTPGEIRVAVSTVDVMPTLLRAAGITAPESLEGWPLPSADDPPGAPEQARAVFAEHPDQIAVVSGENFYARLREPVVATSEQAAEELTAEYLRAALARTARLDPRVDALPPYQPARPTGITPLLEPLVLDFLADSARLSRKSDLEGVAASDSADVVEATGGTVSSPAGTLPEMAPLNPVSVP